MDNQTEEIWLTDSEASAHGTGVFLFSQTQSTQFGNSDWEQSINSQVHGSLQKALVSKITYVECVSRGEKAGVLACKWVPEALAPYKAVVAAATSCVALRCVRRCASYGCVCTVGECK
jgi:hypothetical protein